MSKYILQWVEQKQTSVGPNLSVTLRDDRGQDLTNVTLWPKNWPNYQSLKAGDEIEGDVVTKQNGRYTNITLYPPKNNLGPRPAWAKKEDKIEKAQERKAEYIEKAQDRKELSIAYFNAVNSAIAIANGPHGEKINELEVMQEQIIHWRDWFLEEWRKWDSKDITDKINPF